MRRWRTVEALLPSFSSRVSTVSRDAGRIQHRWAFPPLYIYYEIWRVARSKSNRWASGCLVLWGAVKGPFPWRASRPLAASTRDLSSMACGRMRISILRHCTRCTSFSFFFLLALQASASSSALRISFFQLEAAGRAVASQRVPALLLPSLSLCQHLLTFLLPL
jgi:hypothetical protein